MSKNIIKNKNSWDELDDIDELLTNNTKPVFDEGEVVDAPMTDRACVNLNLQNAGSDMALNAEEVGCVKGKSP